MKTHRAVIHAEIEVLELQLQAVRKGADGTGTASNGTSGSSLHERRMMDNSAAPAKKPQLVVDLTAEAAPVVEGSTFFSPSCHDWEQQCLLTNAAWTPFSSPWRNDSGLGNWPKLVRKADAIIDNIG